MDNSEIRYRWDNLSASDRLAATAHIFHCIVTNAQIGGSFRILIYNFLGFNWAAYSDLYAAGGQDITNGLNQNIKQQELNK